MFFTVTNKLNQPLDLIKARIKTSAYTRLALFPFGATELALNELLQKKEHRDLYSICVDLLHKSNIVAGEQNNLILYWPNIIDDKLASLITYGDSKIQGSQILQVAFNNL